MFGKSSGNSGMILVKNAQDSQQTIINDEGTARRKNEDTGLNNSVYFNYDAMPNASSFIVQPGSGQTTMRAIQPFKVKLDNKKKDVVNTLEVKGDKKLLNQNYINLQHQISKQLN